VSVGNHTNCHFELSALDPERARLELERSHASFERLFGRQRHFAFAYGYGYFDESHVRRVRSLGDCVIWSTGQSTHAPVDRAAGAVLPRIVVDGPWGLRGTAAVIAGRALATRVLGVRSVARQSHGRAHRQGVH
jgi:peptidoglycan/xylan/chitin deacetylase (PgdA/CDA1 family)